MKPNATSSGKVRLFIENFLVYGFGGVISKLIPLIMLPVVTRILPTTDYFGINDLFNTLVQFSSALAVMGMYDAMYRMFFEKDDEKYRRAVCSTTLSFTASASLILFAGILLFRNLISRAFFGSRDYAYVVALAALATLVSATNNIISAPTRMQNKRKVFFITNAVGPLLSYSVAISLLLAGHYVIALPLAAIMSGITMETTFWILNHRWFSPGGFDAKLLKSLLKIAVPLFPNFLIYWVFNSCDKVMITHMLGIGEAGVYSASSKLGHLSQLIYTAFAGGWQFFAFSTMNERNQVKSNSMIFEYLGIVSFAATGFICAWSYGIFRILFPEQYLRGYVVAPYLFLAPLLQMLFQVAANQFLVIKITWPNMLILSSGALSNILINYFLIPIMGIEGAALASLIGYVISDIVCAVVLCRMKLMVITGRFIVASCMMACFMFVWRMFFSLSLIRGTVTATVLVMALAVLYLPDIRNLLNILRK